MLILLQSDATEEERAALEAAIRAAGCSHRKTSTPYGPLWIVEGDLDELRTLPLDLYGGVSRVVTLTRPHALSSLAHKPQPTVVQVGGHRIGAGELTIAAGPCAIESEAQLTATAVAVRDAGAHILRAGAYKPRTSPYAFRGLGLEGLRLLREVSLSIGLPTVSEVTDPRHVEACVSNVDMLQIGTRNMSNFDLLVEVGRSGHPVLLKRGRSATLDDWLSAAEYILAQGNEQVVLCERGVRGFDPATRNLLDLAAVPALRARTHLPVLVDPSHGTGHAAYVPAMARAACAAGADGVLIEVHANPRQARSDAHQAMRPGVFRDLCEDMRLVTSVCRRPTGA